MALDLITDPSINKAAQPSGSSQTAPQAATGAPTTPGTASGTAPQAAAPSSIGPAKQGTGFTNIQRVLGANQGNQLGQTVASGITGAANQATQNIGQAQQQFQQASQAGRSQYTPDAQTQIQQILANPGGATQSQINYVNSLRTGQYGGPQGLANTAALQQQAAQAQALGQLAGTESGRSGLLQQFVGGQNYTGGKSNLDALLLGMQGGGQLAQARRATVGLPGQEQTAEQQAAQQAQQYGQEAQATQGAVTGALGGAQTALQNAVNQQVSNINTQNQNQYNALQQAINQNNLTPAQLQQLGLMAGTKTYGIDPTQYLAQAAQATAANAATPQQYAAAQALAKMAGNTNTFLPQANIAQAGTITSQTPGYSFNRDAFNAAVLGRQTGMQNAALNAPIDNTTQQILKNNNVQMTNDPNQNINQLTNALGPIQQSYNSRLNAGVSATDPGMQSIQAQINGLTSAINNQQNILQQYSVGNVLQ